MLVVAIIILNSAFVYAYPLEKPFVVDLPTEKWIPNTVLLEGFPVFFYKGRWYLCCEGGLIRFNSLTGKFFIYSLPPLKSEYPRISGMARVSGTLWISIQRDEGILIFDLETQSFAESLSMAKGAGFGEGTNLDIMQDSYNEKIWVSSFKHLDVFDLKTNIWQSLDATFADLGVGQPSSWHKVFPDGEVVWVNASAHKYSQGGLIKFDCKNNKNGVFRKELVGSDRGPERLDWMWLISSPNFLWVYFSLYNAYNFYIGVYDKHNNTWKSYSREKIIPALELLVKELPHVKWVGDNFLERLRSRIREAESLPIDHPYKFSPNQIKLLSSAVRKLEAAFKKYDIDHRLINYGLYNHSLHNATIYVKDEPWGEVKPIHRLKLNQIRFERLIGSTGNYAVLETNKGLALFDPEKCGLKYLSPLTKLRGDKLSILWSKNRKRATILEYYEPVCESREYYGFKLLDFENLKITEIKESDELKSEIFKPLSKAFEPLPQNRVSLQNKEIMLRWDGLLIKGVKKR